MLAISIAAIPLQPAARPRPAGTSGLRIICFPTRSMIIMIAPGIAAKAKAMSKFYRENMVRVPLWVQNVPFGVRKRVKYWAQVPGWVYMVGFEHLKLEDS